MIYNNVVLTVDNLSDIQRIKDLVIKCSELSKKEPGCEGFEVFQSQTDPATFILKEKWSSEEDLAKHREAHAFKNIYTPEVLPFVNRVPHPSDKLA